MGKAKPRTILLSLLLSVGMLQPLSVSAQDRPHGGLFEAGGVEQNSGLLNRGSISTNNFSNQFFGETQLGITNESFGNNPTPLGEGLIVMMLGGAGYALLKRKKNNE
jgi:hypothetical protein